MKTGLLFLYFLECFCQKSVCPAEKTSLILPFALDFQVLQSTGMDGEAVL